MSTVYVTGDSLYHFGVFGMKWGVRRYQNKDGTLTDEGKKRYKTVANFNHVRATKKEETKAIIKTAAKRVLITAAVVAAGRLAAQTALGVLMYQKIKDLSPVELDAVDALFGYQLKREQMGIKPIGIKPIGIEPIGIKPIEIKPIELDKIVLPPR